MKRRLTMLLPALLFLFACCIPVTVQAGVIVEANVRSVLDLDKSPVDIFATSDGRWAYILTPGEVQVYAVNTGTLAGRIPVDKAVSRISASSSGNKLYLLNEKTKALTIYSVAFFNMFTVEGSPFKGPADAPVVIADFSDYE